MKGNFYDDYVRAFYNVPIGKIEYQFSEVEDENVVQDIAHEVKDIIKSKYQEKVFDLKAVQNFCKEDE